MLLPIPQQAAQAAAALALGALLAALYDFFKAFRLRASRGCLTAAADTLFSAALLASLFAFAQGPGEGRLRLFMLAAAALGWALWRCTLSRGALRGFSALAEAAARAARPLKNFHPLKKIAKNIFSNCRYGFTIWKNRRRRSGSGRTVNGGQDETKQVWDYRSADRRRPLAVRPRRHSGG